MISGTGKALHTIYTKNRSDMKLFFYPVLFIVVAQISVFGQQVNPEQLLVDFQNKHLGGVDYHQGIVYPHGDDYYFAGVKLIISLTKDVAAIVTVGGSESALTTMKVISYTGDLAVFATNIAMEEGDIAHGTKNSAIDLGVDYVLIRSAEKFIVGKADIPGVRTGIAVYGVVSAGQAEKEKVLSDINEQRELLSFIGETGEEIVGIQEAINKVGDQRKREELNQYLSAMIQKKAEISVYRQIIQAKYKADAGKTLDYAIDQVVPGRASVTMNADFVRQVNEYINGKLAAEEFQSMLKGEIKKRAGNFTVNVDEMVAKLKNDLDAIQTQRELMNRYGGGIIPDDQKVKSFRELDKKIPFNYRLVSNFDLRSIPMNLPDDYLKPGEGKGTFVPEYVNTAAIGPSIPKTVMDADIRATYNAPTTSGVQHILDTYKSIPGGITLEGDASGIQKIQDLVYDEVRNIFIVNQQYIYLCPVRKIEMKDIFRAINRDELMGVSLAGIGQQIIYGKLDEISPVSVHLKLADHFLGQIVFAEDDWLANYKFAKKYQPQKNQTETGSSGVAVYFNFSGFKFVEEGSSIKNNGFNFSVTLVPLTDKKSEEGGHLPDMDAIKNMKISKEYEQNIKHITDNFTYYLNEQILRHVVAYGQVAALARSAKLSNIDMTKISETEMLK